MADKPQQSQGRPSRPEVRRRVLRSLKGAGLALLACAVVTAALYGFYSLTYKDRIYPHLAIGSVDVGGLSRDAAVQALQSQVAAFTPQAMPLQLGTAQLSFSADSLHPSYDVSASVDRAYAVGRSGSWLRDAVAQVGLVLAPASLDPSLTFQSDALEAFLDTASAKADTPEQDAGFSIENGAVVVTPSKGGQRFDRVRLKEQLTRALFALRYPSAINLPLAPTLAAVQEDQVRLLAPTILRMGVQPLTLSHGDFHQQVTSDQIVSWLRVRSVGIATGDSAALARLDIDLDGVKQYLATLGDTLTSEPVDAKLTIVNGKATVFQQSKDGTQLDLDASVQLVANALEQRRTASVADGQEVALAVTEKKPSVSSATLNNLGIQELIGHGETDFSGSPNNRVHNIATGTKYLNGWLVKPGDTFSTVKALGAVDASTGYLPELVIKENKTIPEYGGGLCQVSTTLFRAVLNAGLEVTERRNHSYRVSYYERGVGPGLDATVYLPKPDFQFLNDTPGWILIQAEVKGNTLTFDLYGTKDGRTSTIDGPHTLSKTAPPSPVYETVSTLAPGETKLTEHEHEGAHTIATYTVMKDGKQLYKQTFESIYKALPAHYLKGADAAPAAPVGDTQTEDSSAADATPSA